LSDALKTFWKVFVFPVLLIERNLEYQVRCFSMSLIQPKKF